MIRLIRADLPPELRTRMEDRAARLRQMLEAGEAPPESLLNSYREPELKAHLVAEAHGKCLYCESKVTHIYFGDIEHIKPKARFPHERLDRENLALACALCNHAKADFWEERNTSSQSLCRRSKQRVHRPGFLDCPTSPVPARASNDSSTRA
jgi:uncharacterized protein (TIGR02646 family)